ncbi:MAG TPA: endonuclease/exonuclease/phosphatase family protein [Cyclobacteriaceae bacterium]|nr:endonuclease/exonuclease/phosphatase family protein [Cyclobacteriaceae bacterium]
MPSIVETPPVEVQQELALLRQDLHTLIPSKQLTGNVLIATWNIRAFGDLTEKWEAAENDSPKRDLHSLLAIAEIISHFDIIAVQEIRGNIKCLRHMLKVLGRDWNFLMTDVTRGNAGNNERMAFLYDTRKVNLSGLACELVVPNEWLNRIGENALTRQFARTPYAVSFRVGGKTFVLITLHVLYGDNAAARIPELKAIAEWVADWAKELHSWDHSLIVLGDFNIEKIGDPTYEAFTSTGLTVPAELQNIPRTIFKNSYSFYDQIAWFVDSLARPELSLTFTRGNIYNFVGKVLNNRNYTNTQLSHRISDHFPLWAEFSTL